MLPLVTWFIVVTTILILLFWHRFGKIQKSYAVLPPGPSALPILGNLHQISKNASEQLSKWADQYGPLFTIYLGSRPAIVINDAAHLKKIFALPASTGKFYSEIFNVPFGGAYGIFNSGGKAWNEQRTFFINAMRTAGLSKQSVMEPLILQELEDLCDWIKKEMKDNGKVYLSEGFKKVTGNTIWAAMTEERSKTNIAYLMEEFSRGLEMVTNSGLPFLSWIRYLAPKMSGYSYYMQVCNNVQQFVRKSFEDPRRTGGQHKDLIYKYMEHVNNMEDKASTFYGEEGRKHSFASVVALLMAGTETTATTMNFLICYLCAHPDIQVKVQKEMTEVMGENGEPSLQDRRRMPYTEAVIEESLRMATTAPLGIMHVLLEDTCIFDYKLPKGLCLIPNIYHMLLDPKIWGDPETFRPERFVADQSESDTKNKKEFMVPFQLGKRICPGEQLARDMLFLQVTKLLKTFNFSIELGKNKEEYMDKIYSYISMPKRLGVVATAR